MPASSLHFFHPQPIFPPKRTFVCAAVVGAFFAITLRRGGLDSVNLFGCGRRQLQPVHRTDKLPLLAARD
jgi:hypothetical protein